MSKRILYFVLIVTSLVLGITSAVAQETTVCEPGFYPVAHELGTTCVPENVQRVVTLENSLTEAVLTLGVQPVGVADIELYKSLVTIPNTLADDVVDVGSRREPNLETIISLNPDLIIAASFRVGENYDALNAIAPTVAFAGSEDLETMSDFFTTIALMLGQEAGAEQILEEMYAHFDAASTALAAAEVNPRFVLSQTWYADNMATFRLFTDNAMPVEILTRIGLENTWDAAPEPDGFSVVGIETLGDFTDTNFLFITDVNSESFYEESPLWNSLPFVEDGSAYRMDDNLWLFGGPLSAQRLVDEVLNALGVEFETVICEVGLRPVTHAMGETCVPENPQRVVVLDTGELDNALALGATIVGAPTIDALQYQEYLSDQLDGITDIGAISTPNLEAILALSPDLILGSKQRYEAVYEQLSAIAPTVFTESLRVPWQTNFVLHAEALGETDEAEALLATYESRIAEVQSALGDALDTTTISVIRFRPGQVRLYLKNSYIGYILQDVGLPRPASQDVDEFSAEISLEEVQMVDADYILITGYAQDDSDQDTFLNSLLWQNLSAVENNRALDVDDDTWIAGLGVQSALRVLDDLGRLLSGDAP